MAEQLINEFTVNRPIDEAWTIITDVERIAPCLPGAELQEVEGETYRGVVKVKLGAISSQFKGEANFIDRDDAAITPPDQGRRPRHRRPGQRLGRDHRPGREPVADQHQGGRDHRLHITGKVAQFGRGIMGDVSSKLMAQFANNLNEMLDEQGLDARTGRGRRTSSRPVHCADHRAGRRRRRGERHSGR